LGLQKALQVLKQWPPKEFAQQKPVS
jgi:hypothetical protein